MTADSKLVEVMARAICEQYGQSPSFNWKKYEATARACLAALEAAGWRCVPVEPDGNMQIAGVEEMERVIRGGSGGAFTVWDAMLNAAPKP